MHGMFCRKLVLLIVGFAFGVQNTAFADTSVASRIEGENVYFYTTLHEAVAAAKGVSMTQPDVITLLADVVLKELLQISDGQHIRLIPGNGSITIQRGYENIEYPVIWVSGESASLNLGKPDMEYELIIDGGYLNDPPIKAHTPLIAVSGLDSKLVMYDGVIVQNNYNIGSPPTTSIYQSGAGVFVRTADNLQDRQAEFIIRGGIIRGNINNTQNTIPCGGGVLVTGFGIFTMEGGIIKDNIAYLCGGGFHTGSRGTFRKTGGIIYGSNAPEGYRNTVIEGLVSPRIYGHAVCVALIDSPIYNYRNNTVGEKDHLSYIGSPDTNGFFGEGERWDSHMKTLRLKWLIAILIFIALSVPTFFIIRNKIKNRQNKKAMLNVAYDVALYATLTPQEKKVLDLLLTETSIKVIASMLDLKYAGVAFHCTKIYEKLGVKNRTELLLKYNK
jgi:DNA-binding CsgD family transcriptional regulator